MAVESPPGVAVEPRKHPARRPNADGQGKPRHQPRCHVLLWNDDDHSYEYVIRMMQQLFGHPAERGFQIADEVHHRGRAVCLTTTKELAELKRDQIHAFGKDALVENCRGSMSATIEAEDG